MCDKALDLFEQVPLNLDNVIYIIVLNACAQLANDRAKKVGMKLLNQMPKHLQTNDILLTSAIDMLMRFGDVTSAEHLFQMIKKKDIATYGAMMNGYNINNEPLKCLELLEEMKQHDIILDVIVSSILISACAQIGMVSICQSIVDQIPLHLYDNQRISDSLIDMWVGIDC
jgi:pentatricopeptide repeat protein